MGAVIFFILQMGEIGKRGVGVFEVFGGVKVNYQVLTCDGISDKVRV